MTKSEIIVCPDAASLAWLGAERFVVAAAEAVGRAGRFAVALSGGSTPKTLYQLLATDVFRARVDWPHVHFFWGDERCVPPEHPDSNFRMTREALLDHIPVPPHNIHRMAGELEPQTAAAAYETELRNFFSSELPCFDLLLLGLGEDGHTASLFPGSSALEEKQRPVTAVHVEKLHSHRLTLTLPALNAATYALFLVAGESKQDIVKEVLTSPDAASRYPAARIEPPNGLIWLISEDAAAGLPSDLLVRRDRSRPVPATDSPNS